jgi:hypothetical protein
VLNGSCPSRRETNKPAAAVSKKVESVAVINNRRLGSISESGILPSDRRRRTRLHENEKTLREHGPRRFRIRGARVEGLRVSQARRPHFC